MKTLCIVSHSLSVSSELKNQLSVILGDHVRVTSWPMDIEKNPPGPADLYVASFLSVYREAQSKLPAGASIVKAKRFFNPVHFQKLLSIPSGTRVLIAANSRLSCAVSLKALRQFGVTHLDYVMHDPYHPVPESEGIHIALVAGANKAIPPYVKNVVDIGVKDLALTTYLQIIKFFNLPMRVMDDVLFRYTAPLFDMTCKYYRSEKSMFSIVQGVDDGIFSIDSNGLIVMSNNFASRLFPVRTIEKGKPLAGLFPKLTLPLPLPEDYKLHDKVVERDGQYYILSLESLREKKAGAIVVVRPASRVQELEDIVRYELRLGSNKAKYSFKDILTADTGTLGTIKLAEQFANTRLTVLLEGESGVGKELFAHAVHTASPRAQYPFVAINLAAMPENLAESELFGYTDGAFTGARKGGQRGLFEAAHKGTLFLDEVGEAPLPLQTKLLRALEENEIRRVGGKNNLVVDVRIIAATNKNLNAMVQEKTFRADLFFRLCACPLHIAPLRKKVPDIFLLIAHYATAMRGRAIPLEPELEDFFARYPWPGNVRELQNVVGYIVNVLPRGEAAGLRHMPQYLIDNLRAGQGIELCSGILQGAPSGDGAGKYIFSAWETRLKAQNRDRQALLILRCLDEGWSGRSSGRSSIRKSLQERGLVISLYEIKTCIRLLHKAGFLRVGKTRQGCTITSEGVRFLRRCAERAAEKTVAAA